MITKGMLAGEIISRYPDAAFMLMQCDMGCINRPTSWTEPLQDANMVHGMNTDEVVGYMNKHLQFQVSQGGKGRAE